MNNFIAAVGWSNYDGKKPRGRIFRQPSMTVPGMTMPLEELVRRYTLGRDVTQLQGVYLPDDSLVPDGLENMEFDEKVAALQQLNTSIESIRHGLKKPAPSPNPSPTPTDTPPPAPSPAPPQAPTVA